MPIFEYVCEKCAADFELLVRAGTRLVCPECGSGRIAKRFSTFAAHSGSGGDLPACHSDRPGCDLGKCGSGRCGLS